MIERVWVAIGATMLAIGVAMVIPGAIFAVDRYGTACPNQFVSIGAACVSSNVTAPSHIRVTTPRNDALSIPLLVIGAFAIVLAAVSFLVACAVESSAQIETEPINPERFEAAVRVFLQNRIAEHHVLNPRSSLVLKIDDTAAETVARIALEYGARSAIRRKKWWRESGVEITL